MTVEFTPLFPPIHESDIEALEKQLQVRLPASYRNFLLEHNGGELSPNVFLISEREGNDNLRYLFGIGDDEDYSISGYMEIYSGRIPDNFLAIGADDLGNLVCLSIKGDDVGKIYFWDHDWEVVEGVPDYSNVTLVADSFSQLLEELHDFDGT
jgi:hypothetical protein